MTNEALENIVYDALTEVIVQRVVDKLIGMKKRALVVFTAALMGFPQALESLRRMREDGYVFHVVMTENAGRLLDAAKIEEALKPEKMFVGEQKTIMPEAIAASFDTVIVPCMTINSAAKLAGCISDNIATRVISNSMMRGKQVIVAVDGCCPDNEARAAKGYNFTPALKEKLRGNLEALRGYGATLTVAEKLEAKSKSALLRSLGMGGGKPAAPAAQSVKAAAAQPAACEITPKATAVSGGVHIAKRVIGRTDIIGNLQGGAIYIPKGALVTQLAKDLATHHGVQLIRE